MKKPKLLSLVLENLVQRPVTIEYPKQPTPIEPDARGRHFADLNKCTGCSLCSLECPAECIAMTPIPQGFEVPKINPRKIYPVINYGKCVYCYRCITVCPFNAYIVTNEYRLSSDVKSTSSELSLNSLKKEVR